MNKYLPDLPFSNTEDNAVIDFCKAYNKLTQEQRQEFIDGLSVAEFVDYINIQIKTKKDRKRLLAMLTKSWGKDLIK